MVVAGIIILLLIIGMFLQAVTMPPRQDAEWQKDTDGELPTTPQPGDETSAPLAA